MPPDIPDLNSTDKSALIIQLHAALSAKRASIDQMLWQTPAISLAAQTFILDVAFDTTRPHLYRVVSGLMASFIGFCAWQLFCRHAVLEKEASKHLKALEEKFFGHVVHDKVSIDFEESMHGLAEMPSRTIWKYCLFIVALVGLAPVYQCLCFPNYN